MTMAALPLAGAWRQRLRWPRAPLGPWPVVAGIALAWLVLLIMFAWGSGQTDAGAGSSIGTPGMGMPNMPRMTGMSSTSATTPAGSHAMLAGSGVLAGLAMWGLMVVAMMLPSALPAVRHVAHNSLCWRRRRAMATFIGVYLLVWLAFGLIVVLAGPLWSGLSAALAPSLALAIAAVWQLTPYKRAALNDCHLPVPLPPRGRLASAGVLRFGARNGFACLRSCWAMMVAMVAASSAGSVWMIALTSVAFLEKRSLQPRQAARRAAAALAAGSLIVGLTSG